MTHALHQPWSTLAAELRQQPSGTDAAAFDCDVLIVGSGYGGAVCADALAGLTESRGGGGAEPENLSRVWLLERGQVYEQGRFPSRLAEMPGHVRFTMSNKAEVRGQADGLFDLRMGPSVSAVLANGLGGGSLINAGVMLAPDAATLSHAAWPAQLDRKALLSRMGPLADRLKASTRPSDLPPLQKQQALTRLSRAMPDAKDPRAQAVPVTVDWSQCVNCGDCATGCNHDAKWSLDKTLLRSAANKGARLFTGAAVTLIRKGSPSGWVVSVEHTDPLRAAADDAGLEIRARRVILAAGTFGSTEILMRSARHAQNPLPLSQRQLGRRFSTNGDLLWSVFGQKHLVNAVASETTPPAAREVGPTITHMIDLRSGAQPGRGHVVQDLAVPGPMRELFAELFTTAQAVYGLTHGDWQCHRPSDTDPLLSHAGLLSRSQALAFIGHDDANGFLSGARKVTSGRGIEGLLVPRHPSLRHDGRWHAQLAPWQQTVERSNDGGTVLPIPLWQPAPAALVGLTGKAGGMAVTAHPLGGCAMSDQAQSGVVNHLGQVFKGNRGTDVHEDLVVLDGSVVPTSLGINPALTIAALAQMSVEALAPSWGMTAPAVRPALEVSMPPVYREPATLYGPTALQREGTWIEITEQLQNVLLPDYWDIDRPAGTDLCMTITLRFKPVKVTDLLSTSPGARTLTVDEAHSHLQIHALQATPGRPKKQDPPNGRHVVRHGVKLCAMPVGGELAFMVREHSDPLGRTLRGLQAFLSNRGWRDIVASIKNGELSGLSSVWDAATGTLKVASRAGEVRRFHYTLSVGQGLASTDDPALSDLAGKLVKQFGQSEMRGHKDLTYAVESNPWRQLMQLILTQAPGMKLCAKAPRKLFVNLHYFADQGVPLLRLRSFDNMVDGLVDLGKLSLWMARCLLHVHLWSFRGPDPSPQQVANRLPGVVPQLPHPTRHTVDLPPHPPLNAPDTKLKELKIRLTHYAQKPGHRPIRPVLLIHGYSASGTTFAHASVNPNLAQALHEAHFDVWVLDMRTSPDLPTATLPWRFEEVGYNDIPVAVDQVIRMTGAKKVDVVAHCMGSAMLWMALLGDHLPAGQREPHDHHPDLREKLQGRLGKVVLSQIAPVMTFSPLNQVRAYLSQYLRQFLPRGRFDFRPERDGALDAVLDRLLSAQLYPSHEFRLTNPRNPFKQVPWARTRHRMDALYGRDFNVDQVGEAFLAAIDDHFGPMNLDTVSQGIFFARYQHLTDAEGRHVYVTPARMRRAFQFECLYVHGEENGLSDIEGAYDFERYVEALGPEFAARLRVFPVKKHGHQDCLVGADVGDTVFPEIVTFLDAAPVAVVAPAVPMPTPAPVVRPPVIGPILSLSRQPDVQGLLQAQVIVGHDPMMGPPAAVRLVHHCGACQDHPWLDGGQDIQHVLVPRDWVMAGGSLAVQLVYKGDAVGLAPPPSSEPLVQRDLDLGKARRSLWPAHSSEHEVSLVVGNCRYPHGMLDAAPDQGDWADGPADRVYSALGREGPDMLWLLGDQIYADEMAGVFDPELKSGHHRAAYRRWLSNRRVREALSGPMVHVLPDDHEFRDNWAPLGGRYPDLQAASAEALSSGRAALEASLVGPGLAPNASYTQSFACGQVQCLMLDTRTQRGQRGDGRVGSAHILSGADRALLANFVQVHGPGAYPKVIGSPAAFLPRRRSTHADPSSALASDAWDGYPASLHEVLRLLWDHRAQQVWLVSGDEHLASQSTITLTCQSSGKQTQVRSVHSAGFYAPYPFANACAADFRTQDTFTVEGTHGQLLCTVSTVFEPAGECLARLDMHPDAQDPTGAWIVSPSWIRGAG